MHQPSKLLIQALNTHPNEEQDSTCDQQQLKTSLSRNMKRVDGRKWMLDMNQSSEVLGSSQQHRNRRLPLQQMSNNDQSEPERGLSLSPSLQSQFHKNNNKIEALSQKLDQLYQHYRSKRASLTEQRERIAQIPELRQQNENLSREIGKIRKMVKDALLVREKSRLCGL